MTWRDSDILGLVGMLNDLCHPPEGKAWFLWWLREDPAFTPAKEKPRHQEVQSLDQPPEDPRISKQKEGRIREEILRLVEEARRGEEGRKRLGKIAEAAFRMTDYKMFEVRDHFTTCYEPMPSILRVPRSLLGYCRNTPEGEYCFLILARLYHLLSLHPDGVPWDRIRTCLFCGDYLLKGKGRGRGKEYCSKTCREKKSYTPDRVRSEKVRRQFERKIMEGLSKEEVIEEMKRDPRYKDDIKRLKLEKRMKSTWLRPRGMGTPEY